MKGLSEFLGSSPFILFGALTIFSMTGTFMTLDEDIAMTLEAWRSVTRPIWEFLFGWFFDLIEWRFPWYLKDYFTMGLVTLCMLSRQYAHAIMAGPTKESWELERAPKLKVVHLFAAVLSFSKLAAVALVVFLTFSFFVWPIFWVSNIFFLLFRKMIEAEYEISKNLPMATEKTLNQHLILETRYEILWSTRIFFQTSIYALLAIALNFALINFFDRPTTPPLVEIWV